MRSGRLGKRKHVIGHSTNLLGVPMEFLVHRDFNEYPVPLHISGVREMNASLFEMLAQSTDLLDAGEAFTCYMVAMFGVDREQRVDAAGQRLERSAAGIARHSCG